MKHHAPPPERSATTAAQHEWLGLDGSDGGTDAPGATMAPIVVAQRAAPARDPDRLLRALRVARARRLALGPRGSLR